MCLSAQCSLLTVCENFFEIFHCSYSHLYLPFAIIVMVGMMFSLLPQFMKSCTDLFTFSDTTHVSMKTSQGPPNMTLLPGEPSALDDPLGDTDSNNSLYEATQKTLTLDRSGGSADSADVKMASPEKPSGDGGRSSQDGGQGEGEEVVDVGGVHRCWLVG